MPRRFEVIMIARAERELEEAVLSVAVHSPSGAEHLHEVLVDAIVSLERFPLRFPKAREGSIIGLPLRCRVVLSHRIYYTVRGRTVFVLRVRHAARNDLDSIL